MCTLEQDSRDHDKVIKDWFDEINFFQNKCYAKIPISVENIPIIKMKE